MKKYILKLSLVAAVIFTFGSCGPSEVVVRTRPEPPVYARPVAPGSSHVWVDGEWIWRNGHYVYKPGYWVAPSRRRAVWITGHWEQRRSGWHWVSGRWQ